MGNKLISEVTGFDADNVFDRTIEMGYERKTRKETLRLLKAVLRYARKCGYINEMPEIDIDTKPTKREKLAERAKKEQKSYTPDEVYTMLVAADSLANDENKQIAHAWQRYRAMVYFLVYTGARIGEARAFTRSNYLPNTRKVRITEAASENGEVGDVKTVNGYRRIPLHPNLDEVLRDWTAKTNLELIFGTASDRPNSLGNLSNRMLSPLKERAAALASEGADPRYVTVREGLAFHAFRHHYASQLVKHGADLKKLRNYMGHASAAFTLDTYAHLFEDDDDTVALGMEI